jgi:inosine triphosphate pyrophosphatase
MRKIIFITGNPGKLHEAQSFIPEIVGKDIDLPEIQETDAHKVIEAKLLEARQHHKGEYIIEDTSLYFDCLNGLPGPLIKWFLQKLGDKKLSAIAAKLKNTKAQAKTIIGYINKKGTIKYFEGDVRGKIVSPRGPGGFGWDKIFMPDGFRKTFGEMTLPEKNKISMRKKALVKLKKYLNK